MRWLEELHGEDGAPYFQMTHVAEPNHLYSRWSGHVVRDDVVAGSTRALEWAEANARRLGCLVVVNDIRDLRGSWDPAVEWGEQVFNPRAYAAGIRANAVILARDLLAQQSAENYEATSHPGTILIRIVPSLEAVADLVAEIEREHPDGV